MSHASYGEVFRDRVRGEVMATWGTVEAKRLGLFELLRKRCAIEVRYLTYYVEGAGEPIDLLSAAPHFQPSLAFHHPVMQEVLIEEVAVTGATIWRPSKLVSLKPGSPPTAEVEAPPSLSDGLGAQHCSRAIARECCSSLWGR